MLDYMKSKTLIYLNASLITSDADEYLLLLYLCYKFSQKSGYKTVSMSCILLEKGDQNILFKI